MLITAFMVCSEILPTASAQEASTLGNPQGATAVEQNARFITSIKADSTFVNRCLKDMITILETNREIYNRRVDSLIALQ